MPPKLPIAPVPLVNPQGVLPCVGVLIGFPPWGRGLARQVVRVFEGKPHIGVPGNVGARSPFLALAVADQADHEPPTGSYAPRGAAGLTWQVARGCGPRIRP